MALQIEDRSPGTQSPASVPGAPRNLRLLEPWIPDAGATEGGRHAWAAQPARRAEEQRPAAAIDSVAGASPRPSAMFVMRQLLNAWRSADRQLAALIEGSQERSRLQAHVATLRSLYQGLFVHIRYTQSDRGDPGGS